MNKDKHTIKPKDQLKFLGWIVNRKLDYSDHINYISFMIHKRIHRADVNKLFIYEKARTMYSNAHLFSLLNYGAPSCTAQPISLLRCTHFTCSDHIILEVTSDSK